MDDDAPSQDSDDPLIECLTFTLGNETYGIDVLYVQEVLRSPGISPVPGSPSHIQLYILLSVHELRQDIEAVKTA